MFEYIGAIHMHSIYSDGSGEVPEIVKSASEVGLDYILLTDHNTLRALKEGYEGWHGSTLLLVGCELNDKQNKNHYLAFGINQAFSTRLSAAEYVRKVNEAGGIGFIAHPHEKRTHMKEHPSYPWTDWEVVGFTGIEIWNHMSEWMENLTEENKYQAFLHPLKTIVSPQKKTLKVWDELNLKHKIVGIGGVDAHAHKYNLLGFLEVEIFPYKVLFKSIRTHILTSEEIKKGKTEEAVEKAKKQLYSALAYGSCFIANDYHGDSTGFKFFAESEKKIFNMGDKIAKYAGVKLRIEIPNHKAEIKLIRNGRVIDSWENQEVMVNVNSKGIYRVEVYLNGKAWIYSNHIRIGL
ncbi:MAG: PHP domain-containing protein [Ignavibacteriaceae bacterium]|nr:PHP domain-containing protein [Ignavibacteriaceae bacterium]